MVNGSPIGKAKEVCLLLAEIDNLRPPFPKYNVIWEVETEVNCLKELNDNSLSGKDLTIKTTMLMALTAIKRCSELHFLDNRFMALGEDKIVFKLLGKPKNFRKISKVPDPITFWASGLDLCPVSTIKAYIDRTAPWREGENAETQFYLSYEKPHHAITTSTIGRWLKTVLGNVGVDTTKFTAHSNRAPSSSKYNTLGASVTGIMECGNWKSNSVWQSFYHKPIVSDLREAQKSLLK